MLKRIKLNINPLLACILRNMFFSGNMSSLPAEGLLIFECFIVRVKNNILCLSPGSKIQCICDSEATLAHNATGNPLMRLIIKPLKCTINF